MDLKKIKVLSIVLAGGEGKRLMPLTKERAKPAVPFGGRYRLIDFPLSNLANSGFLQTIVLTQYKSNSLNRHIAAAWGFLGMNSYVSAVPAQQNMGPQWYQGSADAIYQNIQMIKDEAPDYLIICGADHVYRMDFSQMLQSHIETGADFTVSAIRQPLEMADQFGVIEIDDNDHKKIAKFVEKPKQTKGLPDAPDKVLASMGNYIASTKPFLECLEKDANNENSIHDMGTNIATYFVDKNSAGVYDFIENVVPGSFDKDKDYWRDVGNIDQFYDSNMDLLDFTPQFNLYNSLWPLHSAQGTHPPAKLIHDDSDRRGEATNSIICAGVIISGSSVSQSLISPVCYIHSWSRVEKSILFPGVNVDNNAHIHKAIIDKDVYVGKNVRIGIDKEEDEARGFYVSESGITVVPKGTIVDK